MYETFCFVSFHFCFFSHFRKFLQSYGPAVMIFCVEFEFQNCSHLQLTFNLETGLQTSISTFQNIQQNCNIVFLKAFDVCVLAKIS